MDAHLRRVERQDGEILRILADESERQRVALELQKRLHAQVLTGELAVELVAVGVAVVHQDERVRHKVGKVHIIAGRERVFRVRHDDDVLLLLKDLDKLCVEDLRVERVDDVELIFDEHLRDGGDVARVQVDLHVREALVEKRHDIGKRRREQRVERADAHRAAELGIGRGERARPRDGAHHVARVGDEVLAVLRDGDRFADAVKELHTQLALELLYLHCDGGLRIVQRFSSAGKTFEFRNLQEGDQIANLHTSLQFRIYNEFPKIYYWKCRDLSRDLLQIIMVFFKKDGGKDRLHRCSRSFAYSSYSRCSSSCARSLRPASYIALMTGLRSLRLNIALRSISYRPCARWSLVFISA